MLIQQGDVLIHKIASLPKGLKKLGKKEKGFVLADGEVTGHAHVITEEDTVFVAEDGTLYLSVEAPTIIQHEEHKAVTVEPGVYRVGRVQEVDPFSEEIHNVAD